MDRPASPSVDVPYVAELARLALSADEMARFGRELPIILAYVAQLSRADTAGVEPTAHATHVTNVFRADEPGPCLDRDAVLANAPALQQGELIKVPPVIGDDAGAP